MFFDVLILIVIVACAVFGFRNGFLISLARVGGWIGALVVAFLYRDKISDWLLENTDYYEKTQIRVENVCRAFVENYIGEGDPSGGAGGFSKVLERLGEQLAVAASEQITAHLWTVLVFVGIVLGIKLLLFILILLLSKKFHAGMLGGIDGVAGLLFGFFQAIVAILIVFAFILPLSYMVSAKTHDDIQKSMDESIVANLIYENNPLLDFIDGFLPTGLTPDKWLTPENYRNVLEGSTKPRQSESAESLLRSLLPSRDADTGETGDADAGDTGADSIDDGDDAAGGDGG